MDDRVTDDRPTGDTLFDAGARAGDVRAAGDGEHGGGRDGAGRRPLAARMRPRTLDEFVGQAHVLGEGSALRSAIEAGRPHSMILHGPPGSGKTTLARMLAESSQAAFEELSAVQAGRAEVRAVIERAAQRRALGERAQGGGETVFFLDEIHRFNKAQQDALLPAVEEGLITLIGATTENPAFEVNSALLSRTRVYRLQALTADEIAVVLERATDAAGAAGAVVEEGVLAFLAARSEGDARTALNALELALDTAAARGEASVTLALAEDALQRRAVLYDKRGDRHYDYISAWIKATRGSNVDASLYYLAVMLQGGEDARFIARRMVILASEDVGNADPAALPLAVAAAHAVEHVGLPEARFALAQTAIYLSLAPKSDAAGRALSEAERDVRERGAAAVPAWLRANPRSVGSPAGAERVEYENPHGLSGHIGSQELLPQELAGTRFYEPDDAEAALSERLEQVRDARAQRRRGQRE